MPTPSPGRFRYAVLTVFAAVLLTQSSCISQDPATTVTVVVTGISDEDDREDVQVKLKGMADGSSHSIVTTTVNDKMTVRLSPVEDIQAFADKIDFGEVTEVDGRTVKVTFGK